MFSKVLNPPTRRPNRVIRQSADWMVLWDERILEILLHDEPSSAAQIASRNVIHVKQGQVSGRLKRLADHGYIE